MWKTILYFLFINLVFLALVVGIYAIGYEYDKANKLYPESVQLSYDLSLGGVYGQRWARFLDTMLILGLIADIVIIFIWYRRNQPLQQPLDIIT
jgi:hypothetical protein